MVESSSSRARSRTPLAPSCGQLGQHAARQLDDVAAGQRGRHASAAPACRGERREVEAERAQGRRRCASAVAISVARRGEGQPGSAAAGLAGATPSRLAFRRS